MGTRYLIVSKASWRTLFTNNETKVKWTWANLNEAEWTNHQKLHILVTTLINPFQPCNCISDNRELTETGKIFLGLIAKIWMFRDATKVFYAKKFQISRQNTKLKGPRWTFQEPHRQSEIDVFAHRWLFFNSFEFFLSLLDNNFLLLSCRVLLVCASEVNFEMPRPKNIIVKGSVQHCESLCQLPSLHVPVCLNVDNWLQRETGTASQSAKTCNANVAYHNAMQSGYRAAWHVD